MCFLSTTCCGIHHSSHGKTRTSSTTAQSSLPGVSPLIADTVQKRLHGGISERGSLPGANEGHAPEEAFQWQATVQEPNSPPLDPLVLVTEVTEPGLPDLSNEQTEMTPPASPNHCESPYLTTWTDSNGTVFQGNFDEQGNGHGTFTTRYGDSYTGDLVNWLPHGWGKETGLDKTSYEGDFMYGRKHGQGKRVLSDRSSYEGCWFNDKKHGQGTTTLPNGTRYEGRYIDEQLQGKGKVILPSGLSYTGWFVNDYMKLDESNLTDVPFIMLLLGIRGGRGGADSFYALEIVSSFLQQQPEREYKNCAAQLKRTIQYMMHPERESEKIYKSLIDGQKSGKSGNFLLKFGCSNHAVGLNIVQFNSGKSIYLDIFNSGKGLRKYHKKLNISGKKTKFQTMYRVEVPITSITPKIIKKWINANSSFKEIFDAYEMIRGMGKEITINANEAIYQTAQKEDNCSLEWIHAWLRRVLGELKYTQFRLITFKKCLDNLEKHPPDWGNQQQEGQSLTPLEIVKAVLQKKIDKREARIQRLLGQKTQGVPYK